MKFLLLFTIVFSGFCAVIAQCEITPTPTYYRMGLNTHKLESTVRVLETDLSLEEFNYFRDKLKVLTSLDLEKTRDSKKNVIQFISISNSEKDYYELSVRKDIILISYSSVASRFYAINSLLQLIKVDNGICFVQNCEIKDAPKFDWRGLHLDVARHFFTVDEVKRYIDLMAFYKFNKFHWHLTDDQGWRIEIKKYPKLTEIGGYRDSTINGHYNTSPRTYNQDREGGFYTQEEIKDVVAYAMKRSVEVIPEIEMPGHARAALAAYPQYSCTGVQLGIPGLWGVFDDVFCSKPETIVFLQEILMEVLPLFPSDYVHIGGDEAPKSRWKKCTDCQNTIAVNGLHNEHELQSYFIQQMDDFLTSQGKKLIGWDEILEGGLSTNAAVMSWRGEQGGIDAANQDHFVVMSPTTYCYFDYYQSGENSEPLAIGGYLPLEKVYEYNPIPKGLGQEKWKFILGGQANLWTEYVSTFSHVEYMLYPRALALIQSLWCKKKPNYSVFLNDFRRYQEPILKKLDVNYSRSIYATKITNFPSENGIALTVRGVDSLSKTKLTIEGEETPYEKIVSWNDSVYLNRSAPGSLSFLVISAIGVDDERELKEQKIVIHNGIASKVELITKPHSKYSVGGGFLLVDGIQGARPWKGNEWLGFNSDKVEFTIDLGELKKVDKVKVGFLDAKGSWIYLPKELSILYLDMSGKWQEIGTKKVLNESVEINLSVKTKSLKFISQSIDQIPEGAEGAGNLPWTFIDEVQITYDHEN